MSILSKNVKWLYVENVLKVLDFAALVDSTVDRFVPRNLLRDFEIDNKNFLKLNSITKKLLARNKYIDPKVQFNNIFIKLVF